MQEPLWRFPCPLLGVHSAVGAGAFPGFLNQTAVPLESKTNLFLAGGSSEFPGLSTLDVHVALEVSPSSLCFCQIWGCRQ